MSEAFELIATGGDCSLGPKNTYSYLLAFNLLKAEVHLSINLKDSTWSKASFGFVIGV